jgi:hypothetical protein
VTVTARGERTQRRDNKEALTTAKTINLALCGEQKRQSPSYIWTKENAFQTTLHL